MKAWKKYQEQAAKYFRSIGLDAETDVTVQGVRTSHDVDVLVKSHYVGFDIAWIVECKFWKHPVSKLHVLALREIVSDVGADRGILLSESGFQSGAREAANLTNIHVTSIKNMRINASNSIYAMRLSDLYDRVGVCKDRYWNIPKELRIEHGLRPEVGVYDYSATRVIDMFFDLLSKAFRGIYPFQSENIQVSASFGRDKKFESLPEILELVETHILVLEEKLDNYEKVNKAT